MQPAETHVCLMQSSTTAAPISKHLPDIKTQNDHIRSSETCSEKNEKKKILRLALAGKQDAMQCSCLGFMLSTRFFPDFRWYEHDINGLHPS